MEGGGGQGAVGSLRVGGRHPEGEVDMRSGGDRPLGSDMRSGGDIPLGWEAKTTAQRAQGSRSLLPFAAPPTFSTWSLSYAMHV